MTLKNIFFAALFAASAIAAPQPADASADSQIAKRYEPGTCTFHVYESRTNGKKDIEHSIKVEFWDNKGNMDGGKGRKPFYTFPMQDVYKKMDSLKIKPDGFDEPMLFSVIETNEEQRGPNKRLDGWSFSYKGQEWDTNTKTPEHHSSAQEQPGTTGNSERDYDSRFQC